MAVGREMVAWSGPARRGPALALLPGRRRGDGPAGPPRLTWAPPGTGGGHGLRPPAQLAIDDGRWAERVIGPERIKTTYAFRALLDSGAKLALGSDWFVAPPTPLEGIYAAVTRRTLDDKNPGGWVPEQKITVEEALKAYTAAGAYAAFMERDLGTLAPGMLADLTVIDRDLRAIPAIEIRDARIVQTIVGGKTVYRSGS